MSSKQMTECVCDRCGVTESVEQVMGANVFPRGWLGLTVGGQNHGLRDLCVNCSHGFLTFMENPPFVSQSTEAKV